MTNEAQPQFAIVDSSPMAAEPAPTKGNVSLLPFDALEVGKSFAVPLDYLASSTIRNEATKRGKALQRTFRVIKHADVYEVARTA